MHGMIMIDQTDDDNEYDDDDDDDDDDNDRLPKTHIADEQVRQCWR